MRETPWSPTIVEELNEYQHSNMYHPYTCPNRGDGAHDKYGEGTLVATTRGWICPFCDYKQGWSH